MKTRNSMILTAFCVSYEGAENAGYFQDPSF